SRAAPRAAVSAPARGDLGDRPRHAARHRADHGEDAGPARERGDGAEPHAGRQRQESPDQRGALVTVPTTFPAGKSHLSQPRSARLTAMEGVPVALDGHRPASPAMAQYSAANWAAILGGNGIRSPLTIYSACF